MSRRPRPAGARLRRRVRWTGSYAVLQLSGVLDHSSATRLPGILGGCLLGQPPAIVIDVSALRVDDLATLARFTDFADRADDWPGSAVVLAGAGPEVAAALDRAGRLPVYPDGETAEAELAGITAPPRRSTPMEAVVMAARHARELVADACAQWGLAALVGPACIVVTELANNAVVHARTPMEIILSARDQRLNVAVRDWSSVPPDLRGPLTPTSPGGRGLVMVDAVAQRWGWIHTDGGKVVWALIG